MASLTKRCRHRGAERETCGCTWYLRTRTGGRDRYVPCGPDRAEANRVLALHRSAPPSLRVIGRAPGLILPQQDGASWVYFLQGAGLVKIGCTRELTSRMAMLQAASPVALTLILVLEGGQREERALHAHFDAYRRHGEWFALPVGWENDPRLTLAARIAA